MQFDMQFGNLSYTSRKCVGSNPTLSHSMVLNKSLTIGLQCFSRLRYKWPCVWCGRLTKCNNVVGSLFCTADDTWLLLANSKCRKSGWAYAPRTLLVTVNANAIIFVFFLFLCLPRPLVKKMLQAMCLHATSRSKIGQMGLRSSFFHSSFSGNIFLLWNTSGDAPMHQRMVAEVVPP